MASELKRSVALVVGAGSALGTAAARALAEGGATVAACDWSPDAAERVADELSAAGFEALAVDADASKKLALQSAVQTVLAKWERIDVLVNAGTVQPTTALLDMDEWDWRRALDLNFGAAFMATQSVGRVLRELGSGLIVTLVDTSQAAKESAAYMAAAGGLRALSAAAAAELAGSGVVVTCVDVDGADEVAAALDLAMSNAAKTAS
jgi:NAD(P)-dependent dehydrogenase (short-subunit alcohol dehydrogenase family)